MHTFAFLEVIKEARVATVRLRRPELHNAFNPAMIEELTTCFRALADDGETRVAVLTGSGRSFCAGADLEWMRASLDFSWSENIADAERLAVMYEAIDAFPRPLVARINGAALGGGAGLIACCDIAIAVERAVLGFTEVRLGIVPAVIGRFVVPRIGLSHARALFVSGARFDAARAAAIGLVHEVVPEEALDAVVARTVGELLTCAPDAVARVKRLLRDLQRLSPAEQRDYTVEMIAETRTGAEAQAGLRAFLEKSRPPWSEA
jgi:methylglutaconyl-CoA hydratase